MSAEDLLALSDEILLLVDAASLRVEAASPRAQDKLGAVLGRSITELECALPDIFFWDEVQAGGNPELVRAAGLYHRADGSVLAVEKTVWPLPGAPRRYAIRACDASAAQAMEAELAHSTSLLCATLEAVAEGILVIDVAGRIVNFNHRFAALWPLPGELVAAGDDAALLRHLARLTARPRAFRHRWRQLAASRDAESFDSLELADGRVIECRSRPQQLGDQIVGRVFSFNDVSERIQQQRELAAARDAALAASRAKSEFLSQMSHELRTPLNAILGFSELLQAHEDAASREAADAITRAGWHLLDLINEVLDLARVEAGKLQLDAAPVALAALAADCLALIEPLAEKHRIRLVNQLPAEPVWLLADKLRLKQMLINLLSNAVKYNRPGGEARLRLSREGRRWRVWVEDTGIGIGADDQARLFQPFSRVGGKQKLVEGSGIGLAFSRKLAELMDGALAMDSREGEGSRFWIELPEAVAPAAVAVAATSCVLPSFAGKRLLYIEDDAPSRLLFSRLLGQRTAIDVRTASDGESGIAAARDWLPDLIVSDMNLGDLTGFEVVARLKADAATAAIPVYALSANAMADDQAVGLASGFSHYLTKPLSWPALAASLCLAFGAGQDAANR